MVKVAITGGSGFLAAHLIRQLQDKADDVVEEIHTIDRRSKQSQIFDFQNSRIPIIHHCCDLLSRDAVEKALQNIDVVFHLARKQFQYIVPDDKTRLNEQYKRDNLEATESLLDAIFAANVQNLIYVGDAYACLPCQDNFGNSEEIHNDLPSSYMLGYYGETRTRAELLARKKVNSKLPDGHPFQATFLRPTLIYGEGETKLPTVLKQVAKTHNNCLPYIEGPSNGLLQYMYAGNLAILMEENMRLLLTSPDRCSGEFLYCMDQTECILFSEFASRTLKCFNMKLEKPSGLLWNYGRAFWLEFVSGCQKPNVEFSLDAFRFLFVYAAGFSNRKQQLIFNFRTTSQSHLFKRYTNWIKANLAEPITKQQAHAQSNILRMG
ncbi:3Beta-HSD domain-containing protein [Aphelenchoides bicaudatus]|nr:3Beta-HSD domain-containing protein [Aphelenchoides bicaudatus]